MRADGMDCAVTAMTDQVTGWILLGCISDVENTGNLAKINGALVFAGAFGVIFGIVIALITAYSLVREIKKIERATAEMCIRDSHTAVFSGRICSLQRCRLPSRWRVR